MSGSNHIRQLSVGERIAQSCQMEGMRNHCYYSNRQLCRRNRSARVQNTSTRNYNYSEYTCMIAFVEKSSKRQNP